MKVKLIKSRSYTGYGISAKRKYPEIEVSNETGSRLIASGYFEPVADTEEEFAQDEKPVDRMSKEELIAYADRKGIDISACGSNNERKNAIKGFLSRPVARTEADLEINSATPDFSE